MLTIPKFLSIKKNFYIENCIQNSSKTRKSILQAKSFDKNQATENTQTFFNVRYLGLIAKLAVYSDNPGMSIFISKVFYSAKQLSITSNLENTVFKIEAFNCYLRDSGPIGSGRGLIFSGAFLTIKWRFDFKDFTEKRKREKGKRQFAANTDPSNAQLLIFENYIDPSNKDSSPLDFKSNESFSHQTLFDVSLKCALVSQKTLFFAKKYLKDEVKKALKENNLEKFLEYVPKWEADYENFHNSIFVFFLLVFKYLLSELKSQTHQSLKQFVSSKINALNKLALKVSLEELENFNFKK